MSETRSSFLTVLTKLPPLSLKKIANSLEQGIAITRIFDDCPSFLSQDELESYSSLFKKIILSISSIKHTNNGYQLTQVNDQTMIESYECGIIRIARRELLDTKGAIKSEIASLLNLTKTLTQADITGFVCAYVSTINQDIVCQINQDTTFASKESDSQLGAAFNYINTNYRQWILDVLKQTCSFTSTQAPMHNQSLFSPPYNANNATQNTTSTEYKHTPTIWSYTGK